MTKVVFMVFLLYCPPKRPPSDLTATTHSIAQFSPRFNRFRSAGL